MSKLKPSDREALVELEAFLYAHRAQIDYPPGDVRTSRDVATFALDAASMRARLANGLRLQMDCSQAVQLMFKWCGLGDPCGLSFHYAGDTGAMLEHLPHYSKVSSAGRGALVVYGPGRGEHVSIVIEPGRDPLLGSHGRNGWDRWRLSEQRTWHSAPVTFCNVSALGAS